MRKVAFDAQLTGAQRTVFSRELRRRLRRWRDGLVVKSARCSGKYLLSPLVGPDLKRTGRGTL